MRVAKLLLVVCMVLACQLTPGYAASNANNPCSAMKDSIQRLACYDQWSNQAVATEFDIETDAPFRERVNKEKELSIIGDFVIVPHRPTYIMPISYVRDINTEPLREFFGDKVDQVQNVEAKFQLSFKVPILHKVGSENISLWFAYTQLSLWQVYNRDVSSPFRETNYEPELMLVFDTDFKLFGMNNTFFILGLAHQSNGQSDPLSRSWNRLYASFVLEHRNIVMYVKPWLRLPEISEEDNPDIDEYLGHGELSLYYKKNDKTTGLRLWNNFESSSNHTSVQLDWNFPIASGFKGYIQLFNGYGETLLDYDYRTKRIGFGIMLSDWF